MLCKATEEQYAQKWDETQTESTRRQNTSVRQEKAEGLLQRVLESEKVERMAEEERRRDVERVKVETLKEEEGKWVEREAKRKKIEEQDRERLLRARQVGGSGIGAEDVKEFIGELGLTGLGVAFGIAAIAGAVIIMMYGGNKF